MILRSLFFGSLLALRVSAAPAEKPWLFFDLGKTLIDYTSQDTDTKFFPGVADTLKALKQRHYRLGLLVNWPEDEGKDDEEKLQLLKEFTAPTWVDREPLDWTLFDKVLFPPRNAHRKPDSYLFRKALDLAAPHPALFQGEDAGEIQAARAAGLSAHQVNYEPGPGEKVVPILDIDDVEKWAHSNAELWSSGPLARQPSQ